ncbi:YceI family protein [Microscilla marina]|uniref:Lipid/polyisoprenoid-binding YceI-like domain-containing protein n=1 Tax=Microscilla marina ATCC 23134 TaxID=313606 RepID=A1ZYS9_MICM2|nr:YceI family protein [Microscilla marina]EAY24503.1 hypothetical protein M23134_06490 [Microscilla marina ATCC 23134]
MKKTHSLPVLFTLFCLGFAFDSQAQRKQYVAKNSTVKLDFATKAGSIVGENQSATSALNPKTGQMLFTVPVQAFKFKRAIVQKYFNYPGLVYSKKYPFIKFKGKIVDFARIKLRKKREYAIVIEGELTMRGVTRSIKATGQLKTGRKEIVGFAQFNIPDISKYGL